MLSKKAQIMLMMQCFVIIVFKTNTRPIICVALIAHCTPTFWLWKSTLKACLRVTLLQYLLFLTLIHPLKWNQASSVKNVLSRVCAATIIDEYWIDNWIYWITHSYTQLQCIHFITHNNWVYSLPLKTSDPILQPLLQPTLMASLTITRSLAASTNCCRILTGLTHWRL
jgi:hypothetical protein